jgi:hypothetical protein
LHIEWHIAGLHHSLVRLAGGHRIYRGLDGLGEPNVGHEGLEFIQALGPGRHCVFVRRFPLGDLRLALVTLDAKGVRDLRERILLLRTDRSGQAK